MNNTIQIENKKRIALRGAFAIAVLFFILATIVFFTFTNISKKNLSGNVKEFTGVLSFDVDEDDYTIAKIGEQEFALSTIEDYYDIQSLQGQVVTLVVPAQHVGDVNPWILGLKQGDTVLVDYNVVLADHLKDNDTGAKVTLIVMGVFLVVGIALLYWRSKVVATQDALLVEQFANFFAIKQPTYPQRKTFGIYTAVWAVLLFSLSILFATFAPEENLDPLSTSLLIVLGVVFVGGVAGLFVLSKHFNKKEIEFYNQRFPFDFNDLSHVHMKKSVREELERQMQQESKLYPHRFGDGGNGFDVKFGEDGVDLYMLEELPDNPQMMNTANQTEDVFDGVTPPDQFRHVMHLTYQQVNFQAVALVRKGERPLMVVIQSQLDESYASEELQHDLHLLLDVNLLNTLTTFNVPVQNLDHILTNKLAIMQNAQSTKNGGYVIVK